MTSRRPTRRRQGGVRALVVVALVLAVAPLAPRPAAAQGATPGTGCAEGFPRYQPRAVAEGGTLHPNLAVPMSDGVVLRADVTLPAGVPGPYPVALTITGYGKSSPISSLGGGGSSNLVRHGYATVMVDDRGTGSSGGTWDSWGTRTRADYEELLEWIVAQPWSDGRIGLTGASYMGITALFTAATGHPSVKGVFAIVPMADAYRDIVQAGGQLNTAFIPLWLGLVTALGLTPNGMAEAPQVLVDHLLGLTQFQIPTMATAITGGDPAFDGPFWRQRSPIEVVERITAPTFVVGGLDDIFQRGEPMLYERLAGHTDARLLIGPWTHAASGSGLPRDGVPSTAALELQWFDQHVRGLDARAECIPQVTQFIRGRDRYESAPTWPVPGLQAQRWHLRDGGGLTTAGPGQAETGRSYLSLPVTGLCSRSTAQWLIGLVDGTGCATDNRVDELGALTYTSAPMTEEMVINGPIQADVWLTSSAREAAISVAVSDVAPDGTSRGLTNGLLLASHRAVDPALSRTLDGQSIQPWHPFTDTARLPVVPGEPVLLPIEVFPTSASIAPGHRLRISITPHDVPHALPPAPALLASLGATVRVLSDAAHPSSVVLPVAPRADEAVRAAAATAAPSLRSLGASTRAVGHELRTRVLALRD